MQSGGSTGAPQLRASVVKQVLDGVDRLEPSEAKRIRSLVAPQVLEQIETATRVEWVPYELHLRLEEAVLEVLGRERYLAFRSQHTSRLTESPALRQVLSGVLSLFGVSPRRVYHMVPRVYYNMCRGAGDVEIIDEPTGVRIVYTGVPASLVSNHCWRLGLIGTFRTMLIMTRTEGTVEVIEHDVNTGHVVIKSMWKD
jgi:hypothetical protein